MSENREYISVFRGERLKISVFGASHASKIGVTAEGFNKGETFDKEKLGRFLKRRAPSKNAFSTTRIEPDEVIFKDGEENGVLTGDTLVAIIENKAQRSADYGEELRIPRPGHADYVGYAKFGKEYDFRGGGIFSGRMTAPLCIAGGIAKQILDKKGIKICAFIESVGKADCKTYNDIDVCNFDFSAVKEEFPLLDDNDREKAETEIKEAREDGDSVGGRIGCVIKGVPVGTGNTMFGSLESELSMLLFGVPAVKGVEFGKGFEITKMRGSKANDPFVTDGKKITTKTNNNGGINGGIANGMPITFSVAIKPTPSIFKEQESVDLKKMENVKFTIKGRHDACIAVRAVPVIEAVAAIAILDNL